MTTLVSEIGFALGLIVVCSFLPDLATLSRSFLIVLVSFFSAFVLTGLETREIGTPRLGLGAVLRLLLVGLK